MTALSEYQRLECAGLWRPAPKEQRREVIVSFGDATLMLSDPRSQQPLAHWSLPAVELCNPGRMPALYRPGADATEELEIADEAMVAAIAKVHRLLDARRPHRGRLRGVMAAAIAAALLFGVVVWLPGAMVAHTVRVLPDAKRSEIGRRALDDLTRVAGAPCASPEGSAALRALEARLGGSPIAVLHDAPARALALPGGLVAVGRPLIAEYNSADVVAGAILAARTASETQDPLADLLRWTGPRAVFHLLTTGRLPQEALAGYGAQLLASPPPPVDPPRLRAALDAAAIASGPYAATLPPESPARAALTEEPVAGSPALDDDSWVALQGICDG